jgi:hypothetical protein
MLIFDKFSKVICSGSLLQVLIRMKIEINNKYFFTNLF